METTGRLMAVALDDTVQSRGAGAHTFTKACVRVSTPTPAHTGARVPGAGRRSVTQRWIGCTNCHNCRVRTAGVCVAQQMTVPSNPQLN